MKHTMEHVLIITKDENKITKWCDTNCVETFLDFIQYTLDNLNDPNLFWIYVIDKNMCIPLVEYAEKGNMRKRTTEERFKDIKTGDYYKKIA